MSNVGGGTKFRKLRPSGCFNPYEINLFQVQKLNFETVQHVNWIMNDEGRSSPEASGCSQAMSIKARTNPAIVLKSE